jgi:hypothetical protein
VDAMAENEPFWEPQFTASTGPVKILNLEAFVP